MIELCNNIKVNGIVLIIGISIIVFLIVFTYIAGENNKFFSNKMLFWNKNCNPIFWVIAVTSFNIFRKIKIKSSFINNISKYSLLIYIIHENILLRNYIRPYILHLIYNILGYKYIIVWVVLLSIVIFAFSLLIGIIYRVLFGKIIEKLAGKMIVLIDKIYKKYEKIESDDVYVDCYAIYFNEKQSNAIESQINSDENWTKKPFNEKIINKYKKVNVNNFENSYYYLIEFDKNYNAIETNREILDNKPIEWYKSAIYDSDNKTLYYYYRHYEK